MHESLFCNTPDRMDYCELTNGLSNSETTTTDEIVSYIQVRVLGIGAHGKAVLYRNATDNSLVVWKEINITESNTNEIQKEIDILSILDHPNIVAYYNHFVNVDTVFIEMEYANSGSLSNYLKEIPSDLPIPDVLWYFFQIIYGLEYIHRLNIIHRDIKTLNIFMTNSSLIKIGDFGISKVLKENELAKTQVGTPVYMSPEVLQGLSYSCKSDIWASGCVLFELIARKKLFEYSNQLSLIMKIVNGDFQRIPNCSNPDLIDLLQKLLTHDPDQRPTSAEVLKHKVWNGKQQDMVDQIHRIYRMNVLSRPCSGDKKERSIVSLNSEVFVWGGGKACPVKIEQFKETNGALQVSVGKSHFAVLSIEKDLYTWSNGQGDSKLTGQLGHSQMVYKTPRLVNSMKGISIKEVSCGAENTILLSSNGEIFGCGSNYYGQLGVGSKKPEMVNYFTKIPIADNNTGFPVFVNQISCGYYHVAAIAGDEDMLYTWGCGEYGRLGLGDEDNIYKPTLVEIPLHKCKLKLVKCGYDNTFIVHKCSERLLACGNNEFNKLGINISGKGLSGSSQQNFSYDVPFETKFKILVPLRNVKISTVSCGRDHTCVLDIYNKIYLFGDNRFGQLGLGNTKVNKGICKASKILAGKKVEKISCGDYFTIISTIDNQMFGWGRADNGRLGIEVSSDHKCVLHPRPLFGALQNCADIKSFHWHTIIVTEKVLETNTISVSNSTSLMDKLSFKKGDTSENGTHYEGTNSSKIQTWLQAELEADVIYMDQASFTSNTDNLDNNSTELYSCDCGCQKCHNYIKLLENKLKLQKNKTFLP